MDTLFTTLSHAVEGQPAVALAAAFAWGLASLLLSPCHLASIPLVVGFVNGQRQATPARGAAIAGLFSLGLFTTIGVIGAVTAAAGRLMGEVGAWANYAVVAGVFFVVGLSLLDVLPLGWSVPDSTRFRGRGLIAAFALGLIFGIALGPCTFAYMAPMLGVTFAVAGTGALRCAAHRSVRHRSTVRSSCWPARRRVGWAATCGGPTPRAARPTSDTRRAARAGRRGVPDLHGVRTRLEDDRMAEARSAHRGAGVRRRVRMRDDAAPDLRAVGRRAAGSRPSPSNVSTSNTPERAAASSAFLGSPRSASTAPTSRMTARPGRLCCRTYEGGAGVPPEWLVEAAVLRALAPRGRAVPVRGQLGAQPAGRRDRAGAGAAGRDRLVRRLAADARPAGSHRRARGDRHRHLAPPIQGRVRDPGRRGRYGHHALRRGGVPGVPRAGAAPALGAAGSGRRGRIRGRQGRRLPAHA